MTDNMKKFLEYADAHEDVAKAVRELNRETDVEAVKAKFLALAAEQGFTLTDADFEDVNLPVGELTDEEAEKASGGGWFSGFSTYRSGYMPKFRVGQTVHSRQFRLLELETVTYEGTVAWVSPGRDRGMICCEFGYKVIWKYYTCSRGWIRINENGYLYENELYE